MPSWSPPSRGPSPRWPPSTGPSAGGTSCLGRGRRRPWTWWWRRGRGWCWRYLGACVLFFSCVFDGGECDSSDSIRFTSLRNKNDSEPSTTTSGSGSILHCWAWRLRDGQLQWHTPLASSLPASAPVRGFGVFFGVVFFGGGMDWSIESVLPPDTNNETMQHRSLSATWARRRRWWRTQTAS